MSLGVIESVTLGRLPDLGAETNWGTSRSCSSCRPLLSQMSTSEEANRLRQGANAIHSAAEAAMRYEPVVLSGCRRGDEAAAVTVTWTALAKDSALGRVGEVCGR